LLDISGVLFKKEIILINAADFMGNKMNSNMLTKKKKPLEKIIKKLQNIYQKRNNYTSISIQSYIRNKIGFFC